MGIEGVFSFIKGNVVLPLFVLERNFKDRFLFIYGVVCFSVLFCGLLIQGCTPVALYGDVFLCSPFFHDFLR